MKFDSPTAADVAAFLGRGDDPDLVALAGQHLPFVAATVCAYTRGRGFVTTGQVSDIAADLELVIVASTARLASNPEMVRAESIGDYSVSPGAFLGWTLPELAVLHRYRRRAQ